VPWADRFQTSTAEGLLAGLPDDRAEACAHALEQLDGLGLGPPEVRWMGACWKWTVVFEDRDAATGPPAYVIPDPERPRACTRLEAAALRALPAGKLQRPVRDAMATGAQVGSALWIEWDLESPACCADLVTLVRAALEARKDTGTDASAKPDEPSDRQI